MKRTTVTHWRRGGSSMRGCTPTTQSGDDSDNLFCVMDSYRGCMEDIGQSVPDNRYDDSFLLAAEHRRVRITSCRKKPYLTLANTPHLTTTMHVGSFFRPKAAKLRHKPWCCRAAKRRRYGSRKSCMRCSFCGKNGNIRKDCVAWKVT